MKTIKGIYKRSLKRKRDYGVFDDTASKNIFFPTNEIYELVYVIEDLECSNIDEAISVLASKIDSEAPSVEFMWNLAVLAFYEGDVPGIPTNKNDALVRKLIGEISRRKDEEHSWDEEFVFRQLDDFLFYIDHANRLEEIRLGFVGNNRLERDMGVDLYGYFSELYDMQMEEGWRLKWKCRVAKSWLSDYCVTCNGFKSRRIYALDEKENEDKAIFRHIVVENTVMGGWCILLYMQKYMGLSIDWLVNKGADSLFSIKPEDLGQGTCNDDDALDLFLPKSSLPYGKATMLGDDKCRIDLVFNNESGKGQLPKRVHATLLLVNNRLVGVNAEEVMKKRTNLKNKKEMEKEESNEGVEFLMKHAVYGDEVQEFLDTFGSDDDADDDVVFDDEPSEWDYYGNSGERYGWYNGYSDDVIDDAFDGCPEATWNVD